MGANGGVSVLSVLAAFILVVFLLQQALLSDRDNPDGKGMSRILEEYRKVVEERNILKKLKFMREKALEKELTEVKIEAHRSHRELTAQVDQLKEKEKALLHYVDKLESTRSAELGKLTATNAVLTQTLRKLKQLGVRTIEPT